MKALAKVIKASNDAPLDDDAFEWEDNEATMDDDEESGDEQPIEQTVQECLAALLERVDSTALPTM